MEEEVVVEERHQLLEGEEDLLEEVVAVGDLVAGVVEEFLVEVEVVVQQLLEEVVEEEHQVEAVEQVHLMKMRVELVCLLMLRM